jgi:hypothetical protein
VTGLVLRQLCSDFFSELVQETDNGSSPTMAVVLFGRYLCSVPRGDGGGFRFGRCFADFEASALRLCLVNVMLGLDPLPPRNQHDLDNLSLLSSTTLLVHVAFSFFSPSGMWRVSPKQKRIASDAQTASPPSARPRHEASATGSWLTEQDQKNVQDPVAIGAAKSAGSRFSRLLVAKSGDTKMSFTAAMYCVPDDERKFRHFRKYFLSFFKVLRADIFSVSLWLQAFNKYYNGGKGTFNVEKYKMVMELAALPAYAGLFGPIDAGPPRKSLRVKFLRRKCRS